MNEETEKKNKTAIIVFVKNPELGKVKTRLAASVGDERALEIYKHLLEYTRIVLSSVEAERYTYYSEFVDNSDQWSSETFIKKLQKGENLGDRMSNAFKSVFEECGKVLIIGSDCAQLKSHHIDAAIVELESNNVVLGPSLDGGYYLLGMDNFYPFLFEDIEWSTESVLHSTLKIAKNHNLKTSQTEALSDIDYIEDWEKYGL